MNPTEIDPARLDAILASLGRWRLLAREVTAESAGEQQTTSLELLQRTRHLAAGLEALGRLEEEQRRSVNVLRTLDASAQHAVQRLTDRLGSLRRLADAATRLARDADAPAEAVAVRERAHAQLVTVERALEQAQRSTAELARLAERQRRDQRELDALRTELGELLALTERGLAVMTSARRLLDETSESYERAQLSATDLRRDLRFAASGTAFAPPPPPPPTGPSTVPADDPVIVMATAIVEEPMLERSAV